MNAEYDFSKVGAEGLAQSLRMAVAIHVMLLIPALAAAQPGPPPGSAQVAVENGLLPAVTLAGRPVVPWSIEDRMRRYDTPGLGIAVIDDGEIQWASAYGVERSGGADPVTTSTVFQAASISKLVAATVALQLVEAGRLDLDADVSTSLRSWNLPPSEHTERSPVTLRRLLSHPAGVTVGGFPGYPRGSELPTRLEVLDGSGPASSPPIRVDELPGSRYRYSGGGYQIVQMLIEDVTRMELEEVARASVFQPVLLNRGRLHSDRIARARSGVGAALVGHGSAPTRSVTPAFAAGRRTVVRPRGASRRSLRHGSR